MTAPRVDRQTVRVTIAAGPGTVDLSLPVHIPLSELATQVAREAVPHLVKNEVDVSWLESPTSELMLQPEVGNEWQQSLTLSEVGVVDGSVVVLVAREGSERYRPVVEVMQDATARIRSERFREWDADMSLRFTVYAMPIVIGVVSLALGWAAVASGHVVMKSVAIVALGIIAAGFASAGIAIHRGDTYDKRVIPSLLMASYFPAISAVTAVIPGEFGVWHLASAAMVGTALASVYIMLELPPATGHYAVLVPSLSSLLSALVTVVYGHFMNQPVSPFVIAAMVSTFAVIVLKFEPTLSRMGAKLELPTLPPVAETGTDVTTESVLEVSRTLTQDSAWESMVNQLDRNIAARNNALGIMIGTTFSLVVSAFVAASTVSEGEVTYMVSFLTPDQRNVLLWHFMVISAIFVLRGSWYADRGLRSVSMAGGAASWAVYAAGLAAHEPSQNMVRMFICVGVLVVVTLIVTANSWRGTSIQSARTRHRLELMESVLFMFPVLNCVAMFNLFYLVRHR